MFSMIGALSLNNCVGKDNDLPWRIPSDLIFFKLRTQYETVVMGWNTYLSLNKKPLPNRDNVVIVRNKPVKTENGFRFLTFEEILKEESTNKKANYYIIGGPKTWNLFQEHYDNAFITRVQTNINGDSYVDSVIFKNLVLKSSSVNSKDDKSIDSSRDEYNYIIEFYNKN